MRKTKKAGVITLALAVALTACNKKNPAEQIKSNGLPKAAQNAKSSCELAIVDIDSLASQYEYCKEGQKQLEAKQKNYQQQLNAKGQALQNAVVAFQKKLQSGGYSSQQQAEQAQAVLQKQQQDLQAFQERIEGDMARATESYQQTLRDSLRSFIKDYNADGRYKAIFSKSGDNILYNDQSIDITSDVVAGLNKRYKKQSAGK